MITTVMLVQRFATKTLYTRARATDGSTMLAPMSLGAGKGLTLYTRSAQRARLSCRVSARVHRSFKHDPSMLKYVYDLSQTVVLCICASRNA